MERENELNIAVLLPAYNAAEHIADVISGIRSYAPGAEIIVIDDGSLDTTSQVARESGATVVRHETNRGKGAALKTGFEEALKRDVDGVITMDADGQHDPKEIPNLVSAGSDADIVIGSRMHMVGGMPRIRIWTNVNTSRVVCRMAGQEIPDSQSGYRFIRSEVLRRVKVRSNRYDMETEILIRAGRQGFKIVSVPIESIYLGGKSYINPFIDTLRFFKVVLRCKFR
jgi:glycosyltransferase involved in cell wall biosynthesis